MVFIQATGALQPHLLIRTTDTRMLQVGLVFWSIGLVMSILSLWSLRRAFSIEPAARELVTTGPYRFARHPVYTGYIFNYLGTWCFFPSIPFLVMLIGWFLATLLRVRYEEAVLARAFPREYEAYRRAVGAFGPRLTLSPSRERTSSPRAAR
jgi:protein-S-isoprenylcysteine O-methyltransferase Ste14